MKLWTGRFSKEIDKRTNDFNSSITTDSRMFREDIDGSIAHATMLGACGILSTQDCEQIITGLAKIRDEIAEGTLEIDSGAEDIHSFVEAELTRRIGEAGKRLHTGRSRNDQVATDLRIHLRRESEAILALLGQFSGAMRAKAAEYQNTILPGYTHMQRAQPITLWAQFGAYLAMFARDVERLRDAQKRMNQSPLGSGALAGTTYPIDRAMTANLLGFDGVLENTLDGVSDRDFCVELAAALSLIMVHLSRLSEEIILWCSWEFRFAELDDAFSTGSSIMPQKKNPDIPELVRGKAGRVFGDLMGLLSMLKGLPLAYNKDMQEDKDAIFDAVDTVKLCLTTMIPLVQTMRFRPEEMRRAAAGGFINATDCADYLVSKGLPFRDAYKATGELVALCIEKKQTLEGLPLTEYQKICPLFDEGVYDAIALENCVRRRGL